MTEPWGALKFSVSSVLGVAKPFRQNQKAAFFQNETVEGGGKGGGFTITADNKQHKHRRRRTTEATSAERHSPHWGGVDRQSCRIGWCWGVVVAICICCGFVDVEEARVLPGEKKAFLSRVA